jgi:hypothetical protein
MTDPQQPDLEPSAPPDAAVRDVDLPMDLDADGRAVPGNEDVDPEAGATEPPD